MNEYDRNNLKFIMGASPEILQDWHDNADDDDILYAKELIQQAVVELHIKEIERYDNIKDIDIAEKYLSKFKL